ncbi:acetate/propionate family kinase [Pseudazoarcus pumilus]|uniref:Acetate kinase n=1 Tax=Pseudazoarcus pumilus TaxID=2067960 RepID=A0A2I6S335_9RHOO|nr:acetate/propionate family kinase [Pseudazoarcus pumilus]AUN93674.1 acetate kinase [Pseudazoarcus pumilus]
MKALLVLNAGSSSLKFGVFAADRADAPALLSGQIDAIGVKPRLRASKGDERFDEALPTPENAEHAHEDALTWLLDWLREHLAALELVAAGHRVVHGGTHFSAPVRIDETVLEELEALVPLAPLHQPHNLRGIRALAAQLPELPQVACFDTAFHHTQDTRAATFALPRALTEEGVRRYGFHGLSYEYVAAQLPALLDERADGRVVVAHLGAGASLCAVRGRESVATTMGFTALDGLMMATRPGSLDPGVLLYLMEHKRMDAAAITRLLYHESGLAGVSGISPDMRVLLDSDARAAAEAVELYCYRVARETGSLMAALGGLDAIVFTAGVGEHSAPVRERVCELLTWTGLRLDAARNVTHGPRIEADDSAVAVGVVPTDEESVIARATRELLQS